MEWLNYHHLLYFWTVAREGSIARATKVLRLAPATVSAQLKLLETSLEQPLFERVGRRLVLTEVGQVVYRYADEIFSLGRELRETLNGRPSGRPIRLRVGIADAVPKLIAHRLLEPVVSFSEPVHLVCKEATPEQLLDDLMRHELDIILTNTPVTGASRVRAYNHPLGTSGVSFFATRAIAKRHANGFPRSLDAAPMLLPTENTTLRRAIDQYFDAQRIRPELVAEFDDSALMKVFGERGSGIFPGPSVIADDICARYRVAVVGSTTAIRERFYAITVERKIKHPAAAAITEAARIRG